MFVNKNVTFVNVIDNFMSSFINIFGFLSGLSRKDFSVDILYLTEKFKERAPPKEIEYLLKEKVLLKMPNYVWGIEDFNIFNTELTNFFKERKLEELFSDKVVKKPRNQKEAKKFLKDTFRLVFSQMLNTTSEQMALIRSEKLREKNLDYLKISREFIQALEYIKNSLEMQSKIINGAINERKIKSIMRDYSIIILLFLRMYSISYKIHINKFDLAIEETNYLGMERIQFAIGG